MTTTPTAYPELPDLDRLEALARAAAEHGDNIGEDDWYSPDENMAIFSGNPDLALVAACSPVAVLALIELARRAQLEGLSIALREVTDKLSATAAENLSLNLSNIDLRDQLARLSAQPEGEAPQAAPVAYLHQVVCGDGEADQALSFAPDNFPLAGTLGYRSLSYQPLYTAPAAQHADSGAPVAELPALPFTNYNGYSDGSEPLWTKEQMHEYARAALAAQSQGAQAALDDLAWHKEALAAVRGKLTAVWDGVREAVEKYSGKPCEGEPFDCLDELLAAQQAAAPGALPDMPPLPQHSLASMLEDFAAPGHTYSWDEARVVMKQASDALHAVTKWAEARAAAPSAPGTPEAPQTAGARDVLAERLRQVEVEGWTPARDDEYVDGQLASAAVAYAQAYTPYLVPSSWPWAVEWFKPADDRRNLVKAGALIVAEIERLDRAAQLDTAPEAPKEGE